MKADEFHNVMRPLNEACALAGSGWVCLSNPLVGWGREGSKAWKLRVFLRHVALVFRCWRNVAYSHILIREFSTLPLLLTFPFLWPLRKKLYFVIHHNLQWAVRNRIEHFGLMMLSRMGARWVLLETQNFQGFTLKVHPEGLEKFNIPSDRNLALPLPCDAMRLKSGGASLSERAVIGVAGYYRAEKGIEALVGLLKEKLPEFEILLGVPNPEAAAHLDVEVVNTASDEAYRAMISRCDVLVQNGAADSYFYRASGPIADAAACGTAVVAPDFPLIRHQLTSPVLIGELFQPFRVNLQGEPLEKNKGAGSLSAEASAKEEACLEKMPEAVRRAVEKMQRGEYDFETYCEARSAAAIAKQLDDFINGKS